MAKKKKPDDDKTTPFIREDGEDASKSPFRTPSPVAKPPTDIAMFTNYAAAKKWKVPAWAIPLLTSIAVIHVALFVVMWAKSIWEIEQLERPKSIAELAVAPPPPPPPPPPKGGVKPKDVTIQPKKIKVRDIVQPVKIEKQEVQPVETTSGDENGVEGGVEDGVATGDPAGVVAPPPPPPPPPPPAPPALVRPEMLDGLRISGEARIAPDDVTKTEISRSGKDRVSGSFKLCITNEGVVAGVNQLKSTGFTAYDQKILRQMREWRYRPYSVNGKPVPVCTAVTFIYTQK